MQIDSEQFIVRLPVADFIRFTPLPEPTARTGGKSLWRANVGTEWHQAIQKSTRERYPGVLTEVPVSARLTSERWTIELQGRIDLMVPTANEGWEVQEIKTVSAALPADEEALRRDYPAHFLQIAAYEAMLDQNPELRNRFGIRSPGQVLFVDLATGITQKVALQDVEKDRFTAHLGYLRDWLERRRERWDFLRRVQIPPPFDPYRPGQEAARESLTEACRGDGLTLFTAPTGFGKTAFAWEQALRAYQEGRVKRIIYLSCKTSGQWQAMTELERMLGKNTPLRWLRMENKEKHCINSVFHCFEESCSYLTGGKQRSKEALRAPRFRLDPAFSLEEARREGQRSHLCPYEITRHSLREADIWIGDVNYLFSPFAQSVFTEQWGYDPSETFLIVDEAHQLPERTAANWDLTLSLAEAESRLTDFTFHTLHRDLTRAWAEWLNKLATIRATEELNPEEEFRLRSGAEEVWDAWQNLAGPELAFLQPQTLEMMETLERFIQGYREPTLQRHLWAAEAGEVKVSCLDAAGIVGEVLGQFRHALLMSATFGATELFGRQIGRDGNADAIVSATTPWRQDSFDVAIDLRVNTSWRHRTAGLGCTVDTLHTLKDRQEGPVLVFFPSYSYAQTVAGKLDEQYPQWRVACQERGQYQAEGADEDFLEEALAFHDFLFLILGSHYSESIDLLGGRVSLAVVIGPALPQVNAVQKARLKRYPANQRETAIQDVYRIPGMRKINQALGRLIRSPGQEVKVLLHCERFAEKCFHELLHPDHRAKKLISTPEELAQWQAGRTGNKPPVE